MGKIVGLFPGMRTTVCELNHKGHICKFHRISLIDEYLLPLDELTAAIGEMHGDFSLYRPSPINFMGNAAFYQIYTYLNLEVIDQSTPEIVCIKTLSAFFEAKSYSDFQPLARTMAGRRFDYADDALAYLTALYVHRKRNQQ